MIKVGIVDDHALVRQGIRALLERDGNHAVVGEAGDSDQALALVEDRKPDVLLLDVCMPGRSSLNLIPALKQSHPPVRVLMLSMHNDECYVMHALRQGADGYLLKETTGAELVQGIGAVIAGRRYLSRQLAEDVINAVLETAHPGGNATRLTQREEEVLRLTVDGLSSTKIAQRMSISSRTVETHRSNLMRKLGVHTKAELIRFVLEHNSHLKNERGMHSFPAR
jgi:DNA-binding NarL/FixJ family response regulator